MRIITAVAVALLAFAGTASAQDNEATSIAGSNADADSQSISRSDADSNSGNNTINPNQQVGVSFTQTYEASNIPTRTTQRFKTNAAVPLAAAVSFSSDYCGGTASGGASAAGISIGLAKPMMDGNCQALRRSEKFGIAAANAHSAGMTDVAGALIMMQVWEICMAGNDSVVSQTAEACQQLALVNGGMPGTKPAPLPPEPVVVPQSEPSQYSVPQDAQPRNPRGEVTPASDDSKKLAATTIRGSNGQSVELDESGKKVGR